MRKARSTRKVRQREDSRDPGATVNGRTESRQRSEESESLKVVIKMAEGDRMQLRSMVDKDKEDNLGEGATHDGEGPDITETVTPVTTDQIQEWSDGLDNIDRVVRVSSRKVRKFWYIPDLKNTQLKNLGDARLQHPNDPMHILINAPELKRFFKTSTFEISIDSGKMYTYTDPKVDIGVGLEDMAFDIEKLEDHFKEHTKVPEVYH